MIAGWSPMLDPEHASHRCALLFSKQHERFCEMTDPQFAAPLNFWIVFLAARACREVGVEGLLPELWMRGTTPDPDPFAGLGLHGRLQLCRVVESQYGGWNIALPWVDFHLSPTGMTYYMPFGGPLTHKEVSSQSYASAVRAVVDATKNNRIQPCTWARRN